MNAIADLTSWDMPFAGAPCPSVSLITEQGGDAATIIVAPHGIDQYPKYLVRFDKVLAVLCYEEALDLERVYPGLPNPCLPDAPTCGQILPGCVQAVAGPLTFSNGQTFSTT
jgi:hypothetical protein